MTNFSPDVGSGNNSGSDFCGLNTLKARASVLVGSFKVETPDIISIVVNRTRGQLVNTAQVQFHCNNCSSAAGSSISISIGALVFTGIVKRIDISPSFRCAGEKIVRIQAEDMLYKIVNRNITRRQKHPGLGVIAFISSIYKRVNVGFDSVRNAYDISQSSSDIDIFTHTLNFAETSNFVNVGQSNTTGALHPVTKVSDPLTSSSTTAGGGGFILHSHESLDLTERGGGAAKAVFGIK